VGLAVNPIVPHPHWPKTSMDAITIASVNNILLLTNNGLIILILFEIMAMLFIIPD
jgi:hypothetical protein